MKKKRKLLILKHIISNKNINYKQFNSKYIYLYIIFKSRFEIA